MFSALACFISYGLKMMYHCLNKLLVFKKKIKTALYIYIETKVSHLSLPSVLCNWNGILKGKCCLNWDLGNKYKIGKLSTWIIWKGDPMPNLVEISRHYGYLEWNWVCAIRQIWNFPFQCRLHITYWDNYNEANDTKPQLLNHNNNVSCYDY
jgi:hypothetical protein